MGDEARFHATLARLSADRPGEVSDIGAAILAAVDAGLCADTRTFARETGIAHAIVIRECHALGEGAGLVRLVERDARTQRMTIALTGRGRALLAGAAPGRPMGQTPGEGG